MVLVQKKKINSQNNIQSLCASVTEKASKECTFQRR